ncbi:MAG TPA: SPOR domain-containing protein [Bryobacteraceae bacterium]|jgi:cell division septation protein DedD
MRSSNNSETEILLGNKHLLGIFFVIAILLGVAFTGGYMVGRNSAEKSAEKRTAAVSAGTPDVAATPASPSNLETHSVPPASSEGASEPQKSDTHVAETAPPPQEAPLGSPKRKTIPAQGMPATVESPSAGYLPQNGQSFLQVAATSRNEADAIADVLNKKGFHAHSVAKPGSTTIYRVLIGPIRDTADLSSTRDQLRNNGFRDVIVQRY